MDAYPREWLLDFKDRGHSGCCDQNFLFRSNKVYVMDNHRAALWCWLQNLPKEGDFQIIHIDRHTDCLSSRLDEWTEQSTDVASISLNEYLARRFRLVTGDTCLFRWDNFLSLLIRHYHSRLRELHLATQPNVGEEPEIDYHWISPHDLPERLTHFFERSDCLPTILDIDLDYFVNRVDSNTHFPMFSVDYLTSIGQALRTWIEHPLCLCTTIALSPECCGGWEIAEQLLSTLSESTGKDLRLPRQG